VLETLHRYGSLHDIWDQTVICRPAEASSAASKGVTREKMNRMELV